MKNAKNLTKKEIEGKIKDIFSKNPSQKEIKKAKNLAMSKNIKLGEFKKKFCKKCLTYFNQGNYQIRIKNGFKILKCKNCNYISRYKLNALGWI